MLKLNDLDGFKLVNINYLATNDEVTAALKDAFEQGSQGWGVRPEVAVFLSLANQLRVQITLADVADEAQRQLKGEQMGHGRTKKRLDTMSNVHTAALKSAESLGVQLLTLTKRLEAVESLYDAQTAKIAQLTTERDSLKTRLKFALAAPTDISQTVVLDK